MWVKPNSSTLHTVARTRPFIAAEFQSAGKHCHTDPHHHNLYPDRDRGFFRTRRLLVRCLVVASVAKITHIFQKGRMNASTVRCGRIFHRRNLMRKVLRAIVSGSVSSPDRHPDSSFIGNRQVPTDKSRSLQ